MLRRFSANQRCSVFGLLRFCASQQRAPYQTSEQGIVTTSALKISIRPSASKSQATIPTKIPMPSATGKFIGRCAMVFKRGCFRCAALACCRGRGCGSGGLRIAMSRGLHQRQKNAAGFRQESARGFGWLRSFRSLSSWSSSSDAMIVR